MGFGNSLPLFVLMAAWFPSFHIYSLHSIIIIVILFCWMVHSVNALEGVGNYQELPFHSLTCNIIRKTIKDLKKTLSQTQCSCPTFNLIALNCTHIVTLK
eukprot:Rmarinus@m.12148